MFVRLDARVLIYRFPVLTLVCCVARSTVPCVLCVMLQDLIDPSQPNNGSAPLPRQSLTGGVDTKITVSTADTRSCAPFLLLFSSLTALFVDCRGFVLLSFRAGC